MKTLHIVKYTMLLVLAMLVLQSCKKEELFQPAAPQIVELAFSGTTSVPLEFVYDNVVVDTTVGQNNSLPNPFPLNIAKGDQKIYVRKKGETDILKTFTINPASFQQKFGVLYDDGKIYDNSISYNLAIHPVGKDVEIFIDGNMKVQTSYGGILDSKITIPIDQGQTRELTVKIKGEDEVILSRTIAEADSNKVLKFFLDGKKPVEEMVLPALKNPQGMSLTFQLHPDVEYGQTTFLGGDVDIVFYIRDLNTEEVTLLNPEVRVTVPQGQPFVTVELPPLPDSKMYTFDIFKKGTNEVVYRSNSPGYTVQPGLGKYGLVYFFKDLQFNYFLPGERLVCTLSVNEEFGGANFDEIYVTPKEFGLLTDYTNIR